MAASTMVILKFSDVRIISNSCPILMEFSPNFVVDQDLKFEARLCFSVCFPLREGD